MSPDTLQGNGFGEVSYGGRLMGSRPSAETGDLPGSSDGQLVLFGRLVHRLRTPVQGLSDLGDDEMVAACFCGMAIGWSWSLYLANEAVVHQTSSGDGSQNDIIRGKMPPPLVQPQKPAVGVYCGQCSNLWRRCWSGEPSHAGHWQRIQ